MALAIYLDSFHISKFNFLTFLKLEGCDSTPFDDTHGPLPWYNRDLALSSEICVVNQPSAIVLGYRLGEIPRRNTSATETDLLVLIDNTSFWWHGLIPEITFPEVGASCNNSSMTWGGRFKNAYELLNLRALKISMLYKSHIFQCMGKIFCVEFQRVPLKFHTKYHTHTLEDVDFIHRWKFKSS